MEKGTTGECGTGGVPHPLPSQHPPACSYIKTLQSHLPCALQAPVLSPDLVLVAQMALQRGAGTEEAAAPMGILLFLFFIPGSNILGKNA